MLLNYSQECQTKVQQSAVERQRSRSKSPPTGSENSKVSEGYKDDVHTKLKLLKTTEMLEKQLDRNKRDHNLEYEDPEYIKTSALGKSTHSFGSPNTKHSKYWASAIPIKPMDSVVQSKVEELQPLIPLLVDEEVAAEAEAGTKDELFHLDIENIEAYKDSRDKEKFDYHQRKSKAIRRTQYSARLESSKSRGPRSPKLASSVVSPRKGDGVDSKDSQEPRSDPGKRFPVWAIINGTAHPAYISSPLGFVLSGDGKNIEIKEGDRVLVIPKANQGFRHLNGTVYKASRQDGDCDFAVIDPSLGRFPIQITERKKKRNILDSNCTLYDVKGEKLGKAKIALQDKDRPHIKEGSSNSTPFSKGVLVESNGDPYLVLVRFPKAGWVSYKKEGENSDNLTKDKIQHEKNVVLGSHRSTVLVLEPRKDVKEDKRYPRLVYLFGPKNTIENIPLFEGEPVTAVCEDNQTYKGPLKVQITDEDAEEPLLWILHKKTRPEGRNSSSAGPEVEQIEFVHVDLAKKSNKEDTEDFLKQIDEIALARKDKISKDNDRLKEGLDFRIVDRQGRKLRVRITDDTSEDFQPEDSLQLTPADFENGEEPEAIYYRLEYDGEKVVPLNVMKRVSNSKPNSHKKSNQGSNQKWVSPRDPEWSASKNASTTPKVTRYDQEHDPEAESFDYVELDQREGLLGSNLASNGKSLSKQPLGRDSASSKKDNHISPNSNFKRSRDPLAWSSGAKQEDLRMKIDTGDHGHQRVEIWGEKGASSVSKNSGSKSSKPSKLSEQLRMLENKAATDIQVYLSYILNKPKFQQRNTAKLGRLRQKFSREKGRFREFVHYYLRPLTAVAIDEAVAHFDNQSDFAED